MPDNAKNSLLLTFFNKLDEQDKDAIIRLAESLITKHKQNIINDEYLVEEIQRRKKKL